MDLGVDFFLDFAHQCLIKRVDPKGWRRAGIICEKRFVDAHFREFLEMLREIID